MAPRGAEAEIALVQSLYAQGKMIDADEAIDAAMKRSPRDPRLVLLRGLVDQRLGRAERAIAGLASLASTASPYATEASVALAETLFFAHRREALAEFVGASQVLARDPRGALIRARIRSWADPDGAAADLTRISSESAGGAGVVLKRVAGFEAVALLDKLGKYRDAFALATQLHRETTRPYDLEGLLGKIRKQLEVLGRSGKWEVPKVEPVQGVALVVGLPRSGTTLLEQMLDAHPKISGIREYDGVERIVEGVASLGFQGALPAGSVRDLRDRYLAGARRIARTGTEWTFDKTLTVWNALPEVTGVLPGARMIHVARDPRDNAISAFLSFFNPTYYGWMSSLASIRQVIDAERLLLPEALAKLGVAHEAIVYEQLIDAPAQHAARILKLLGLGAHEGVVQPERNARTVFTLSHDQVNKPINRSSIDRWRNYEWAFDESWDQLVGIHDKRRASA